MNDSCGEFLAKYPNRFRTALSGELLLVLLAVFRRLPINFELLNPAIRLNARAGPKA